MTLALFFLMQALIVSHPVPATKEAFKKKVTIYETVQPTEPPPPVDPGRPPITDSPGIPVTVYVPDPEQAPRIISENKYIPPTPEIEATNKGNNDAFKFVEAPTLYPVTAVTRGVEGFAVVEFTVGADGSILDAVLVEEGPEGYGFGRAALQAIVKFKYQPRIVDGQALATTGLRERFIFELEEKK